MNIFTLVKLLNTFENLLSILIPTIVEYTCSTVVYSWKTVEHTHATAVYSCKTVVYSCKSVIYVCKTVIYSEKTVEKTCLFHPFISNICVTIFLGIRLVPDKLLTVLVIYLQLNWSPRYKWTICRYSIEYVLSILNLFNPLPWKCVWEVDHTDRTTDTHQTQFYLPSSATSRKSPNVYKSSPKMTSLEKLKILTPLQKLPMNVGDLGKLIAAKGFEKLPKVAKSGHTVAK